MKVIIYCLILLTIPLMLSSLASADTIYFKDGMVVHEIARTWRADRQVKWKILGITIGYPEEDVERVKKTQIEEDPIGEDPIETQPIVNRRIKKEVKSPFPSLNPLELEVDQVYFVSKKTPLMPAHSPADPIAALEKMKYITPGGGFRVLDTFDKNGNLWYRVRVFDRRKKQFVRGWINSAALVGQQLKAYKYQQTRKTPLQKQNKGSTSFNPIAKVPRSKAKTDIKAKLAQDYAGNYSVQKMLLGDNMEDYDNLISLPSNAVNNQILSKLMRDYYPNFSVINMLYEDNIKAYRELQN